MWSTVTTLFASTEGGRNVTGETIVPRRILSVRAARPASVVHASRELPRRLSRHRQHGAVRRGVRDLGRRRADECDEAGDVDHAAAAAALQMWDSVLAAEEDALRVDVLHAVPRLDARLEHGRVVVR